MKKSLLVLAALTAFAGVASAQSSVTLFGIVDLSARDVKNAAGSRKSLSSDGAASSRLGFRGVEDLGGGLRASFHLEGSLQADTGNAAGQTWQRRSTVSLSGGFGEVRLGRDYMPSFWNHTVFDPFGTNGVANSMNVWGSAAANAGQDTVRTNNSIGYFLPSGLGGLYGQVQVAAGEGVSGNKHKGLRIGYAAGPVNIAVGWGETAITPSVDWERTNIGASWDMGFLRLMGYFAKAERTGGAEVEQYLIGGVIPFGASQIKFSYTESDGKGTASSQDAKQFGVGYLYSLSKRTTLYAHYAKISNKSGAAYTASGSGAANALGHNSTGYEFGVSHSF